MPTCKVCGRRNNASHRYCPQCGNALLPTPNQPVHGHAAIRSVANERKFVTVLFADLCNSTELISDADPEEAQRRLSVAIAAMSESVQEYGGTISQLLGDGLLALFGAPVAQEDHALRACLAAIGLQQRMRAMTISRPLQVRVGIHSGEVVVGTASQYLSQHYRADGSTIHIAARLEKLAQPGTGWITRETFRLAESGIEVRSQGEHDLRDGHPPRKLYSLVTTGQRSAAAPLARRTTLAPLIGRDQALAKLRVPMEACLQRSFRLVGLRGEAGVGKSRLLATFRDELRSQGFREFAVAPGAYATHVAYNLASAIVRALLGLSPISDIRNQREAAAVEMASWPLPSLGHQRAINDLLGSPQADSLWSGLTPMQRQRHLVDAVKWLIERQLERGPVAILIDDVHQADNASLRLLDKVFPRLRDRSALIVASSRKEFADRWYASAWFAEQWLDPLSDADMNRLATALLGTHESVAPLIDFVVRRADGNPFFLEQLVITLIDNVSLVGAPGDYRCIKSFSELAIPVSIAAVISARVDLLTPASKAALEAASVLGEPISIKAVAAMQQIDPADARRQLALGVGAGLLRPQEATREEFYEFRHALVREVVCSALTQGRLKGLHRAAFIALHGQAAAADTELEPLLARHALQGELWLEAAAHALKAMGRSIARCANRDALVMFELGLDATCHQGDGDAALQRAELALRMKVIGAQLPLGQSATIVDNLERATAIARQLEDPHTEASASSQLALVQWTRGEYALGLKAAEVAALSAASSENRNLQLAALQARVLLYHAQGRYSEALANVRLAQAVCGAELSQRQILPGWIVLAECNMLVFKADCLWRMAEFDAAQEALDGSYRVLAQNEHAFTRSVTDFVQGDLWIARGLAAEAVKLLDSSLALCRSADIPTMYPPLLALHCIALACSGQAAAAFETLSVANQQELYRAGGRYNEYYFPRGLAICLIELGRHEEALAQAQAARNAAITSEQHGHLVDAMHLEGECLVALGRHEAACSCLLEAATRADACSMNLTASRVRTLIERLAPSPAAATAQAIAPAPRTAERST